MTERGTEAVLPPADVKNILEICAPEGVLVGGQALAFWSDHLNVRRPQALEGAITADADFIAGSALARTLGETLGWEWWIPQLDDATPQTGKVTRRLKDGSIKQVDFLSSVAGLNTKDVIRRAIEVHLPDAGTMRVMNPIDVLDSRIQNLDLIPEKRTKAGIAQALLALDVVNAYIRSEIAAHGERAALKLLERVAAIAGDIGAIRVFLLYGIDPLGAIPLSDFQTTSTLHAKRWPQLRERIASQRKSLRDLMTARADRPKKKRS